MTHHHDGENPGNSFFKNTDLNAINIELKP